jgi:FkbM family methyltransferase
MSFINRLVPDSFKNYIRRKSGVPDMFFSLERLNALGFKPQQIIDVGAYEGEWTKSCMQVFPGASYLMLEAMQQKQSKLKEISEAKSNVTYDIALLAQADNEELYFTELETASSVLEEVVNKQNRTKRKSITLNTVLKHKEISKVDLIKLDVQGYEAEVLKGFSDYLPTTEVIISEVSLLDIHKEVPLIRDMINYMYEYNFVVYDICSVSTRRPLDKALWQTDLLFVKESSSFRSDKRYNV